MPHFGLPPDLPKWMWRRDRVNSVNADESDRAKCRHLALQLLFLRTSESMGNHDSNVVGAGRVG
jgi:hypothetical protein